MERTKKEDRGNGNFSFYIRIVLDCSRIKFDKCKITQIYRRPFPSRLDDRIIELVGIPFRYLEWDGDKKSEMGRVNSFKNSFRCYHSFGNYERNDNNECWNAR